MIKLFLLSVVLFFLGFQITNSDTMMSVHFNDYRLYGSVFSFAGLIFAILWLWKLLFLPMHLLGILKKRHQKIKEQKKHDLLLTVLQAITNQEVELFPDLLKKNEKLFGQDSYIYWMIRCLLLPDENAYHQLMQFPQTTLGGIRGLFREADTQGDLQQMRILLDGLPDKKKKTPWALQANFQLACQENNWEEALSYLKKMKSILTPEDYDRRRACCLFLCDDVKDAYKLDPMNPAIAIGFAKQNPQKAGKVFKKVWEKTPCWPVYEAYKELLVSLDAKKRQSAIKNMVSENPYERLSLLAMADIYLNTQEPIQAKKYLDEFLQSYALTKQVALMQARVERDAWNHEDKAREWEDKAVETDEDETAWVCHACDYKSPSWHGLCPMCHTFNGLK